MDGGGGTYRVVPQVRGKKFYTHQGGGTRVGGNGGPAPRWGAGPRISQGERNGGGSGRGGVFFFGGKVFFLGGGVNDQGPTNRQKKSGAPENLGGGKHSPSTKKDAGGGGPGGCNGIPHGAAPPPGAPACRQHVAFVALGFLGFLGGPVGKKPEKRNNHSSPFLVFGSVPKGGPRGGGEPGPG